MRVTVLGASVAAALLNVLPPAPSVVVTTPLGAECPDDGAPAAVAVGLPLIVLCGPPRTGAGQRPTFRWLPVDGAVSYRLAVLTGDGRPLWAWEGDATEVVLGGWVEPVPADVPGPLLAAPGAWFVTAVDAAAALLAISPLRPVEA